VKFPVTNLRYDGLDVLKEIHSSVKLNILQILFGHNRMGIKLELQMVHLEDLVVLSIGEVTTDVHWDTSQFLHGIQLSSEMGCV